MSDLLGIGLDLCSVSRMEELLASGRRLTRMFHPAEEAYIRGKGAAAAQSAAGIYAAKEAVLKALGAGLSIPMTDITVSHTSLGQPQISVTGKAATAGGSFLVSITHEGDMAAAMVVWSR